MKSPPGIFLLSYLLLQSTDSSQAFFVREGRSSITSTTRTTVLFESDSPHKQAIQVALEASKKFGATSPEARVAWDIAEEVENSFFSPCSKRCDPISVKMKEKNDDRGFPLALIDGIQPRDGTISDGNEK